MAGNETYLGIGWRGDITGLQAFVQATRNQLSAVATQFKELNAQMATARLGMPLGSLAPQYEQKTGTQLAGMYTTSSDELDAYNKVLKTTTALHANLGNGTDFVISKFDTFASSTKQLTTALVAQQNAQIAILATEERTMGAGGQITAAEQQWKTATANVAAYRNQLEGLTPAEEKFATTRAKLGNATAQMNRYQERYNTLVAQNPEVASNLQMYNNAGVPMYTEQQAANQLKMAEAAVAIQKASPPANMPTNVAALQQMSPQLYNQLVQAGLGSGAEGSLNANLLQNANINEPIQNLRTGMTEFSGQFRNAKGILTDFRAEVDSSGKVITRFGGQMSGMGNMLRQTGRDFQKVIEWTIATTLVIGTLGLAMTKIKEIVDLDKSLRQFSLTAQMSVSDSRQYFSTIVEVANATATPLQEMLSAMDDIALATKKNGQSMEEWQQGISDVAMAAGILTNIANMTTVQATDALTAIMKQLNLAPDQLIGIENKIAAVAGGQANAISDVTTGLSVMAQAGTQARMTIDEQIASVQVLAQVTAKTPAQVATAFKNLVGSIDSSASIKELNKFGIAVRDQTGAIRPFLDIYRDIATAIKQGIIPAGQEKEVVKAISGGPRRAPDAAALLNAVSQIDDATQKSLNATNEGLQANARIMDSTAAKLTIFQNSLTAMVFDKFGKGISDLAVTLLPVLTQITDIFGDVGVEVLGSFGSALKSLIGIFSTLGGVLSPVVSLFGALGPAIKPLLNLITLLAIFKGVGAVMASMTTYGVALKNSIVQTTASFMGQAESSKAAQLSLQSYWETASTATAAEERLALSVKGTTGAIIAQTEASRLGGLTTGLMSGTSSKLGMAGLGIGAAAGLTAAIGLGATQGFNQDTGTVLTSLGMLALIAPVPIPPLKALGAALLGVGTLMTIFGGSTKDTTSSLQDNANQILENLQNIKSLQDQQESLTHAQSEDQKIIDTLSASTNNTADTTKALTDAQVDYATKGVDLINVNSGLTQSYDKLSEAINKIAGDKSIDNLAVKLKEAALGQLRGTDLNSLIYQLLNITSPDLFPNASSSDIQRPGAPSVTPPAPKNISQAGLTPEEQYAYNLSLSGPGYRKPSIDQDALKSALAKIAAFNVSPQGQTQLGAEDITSVLTYQEKESKLLDGLTMIWGSNVPNGQGGKFNVTQAQANLTAYTTLMSKANSIKGAAQGPATQEIQSLFPTVDLGNGLTAITDQAVSMEKVKQLYIDLNIASLTAAKGSKEYNKSVSDITAAASKSDVLIAFWKELSGQTINATGTVIDYSETLQKLMTEVEASKAKTLGSFASDAAAAQANILAGSNVSDNQATLAAINAEIKGYGDLYDNLEELTAGFAAFGADQDTVAANMTSVWGSALQNIVGLQDASTLSMTQMIDRLFALGKQYGLNATQMTSLMAQMQQMITITQDLAGLNVVITPSMDLTHLIEQEKAVIQSLISIGVKDITTGNWGAAIGDSAKTLQAMAALADLEKLNTTTNKMNQILGSGVGTKTSSTGSGAAASAPKGTTGTLEIPTEIIQSGNMQALLKQAVTNAINLQHTIPGYDEAAKLDIVALLNGTKNVMQVNGVKSELLSKALQELADIEKARLAFDTKADMIRRIRVGAGDFSAIANVPVNSTTGVSMGNPNSINVTLNINGTVLTPAQLSQFADLVGSSIKRQIAG